jgi:hypothetical protein
VSADIAALQSVRRFNNEGMAAADKVSSAFDGKRVV